MKYIHDLWFIIQEGLAQVLVQEYLDNLDKQIYLARKQHQVDYLATQARHSVLRLRLQVLLARFLVLNR
jgi:hypothetical protein